MINSLFFELLQISIGTRQSLSSAVGELGRTTPSAKQWAELFALSKKQALVGIAFAGTKKLPADQTPPVELISQFVFYAAKIQQRNNELNEQCAKLCAKLSADGLLCCVLKGQSNLVNYPEELREYRTPGDIDVLIRSKEDSCAIDLPIHYCITQCHLYNMPVGKICYHHMDMPWGGTTEVEAHHRATWLNSPIRNWRLQRWLEENMPFMQVTAPEGFPIPSNSYNAIYQLLHIYKHLFEEGIGLRQLLDYYFVLKALEESKQTAKEEIMHTLSRFGMAKFAGATMYVLQTVFAMPDVYLLCPPNEREGRFLLNEIMMAGNFGKYDNRIKHGGTQSQHAWEKTKHNLRLLTHYPEEVLWEPIFRVYHWVWRKLELWKW